MKITNFTKHKLLICIGYEEDVEPSKAISFDSGQEIVVDDKFNKMVIGVL